MLAKEEDPAAAPLLINLLDEDTEAEVFEVLEHARQQGLTEKGRKESAEMLAQLRAQPLTVAHNVIILIGNLSQKAAKDLGCRKLYGAASGWLDRARRQLRDEWGAIPDDEKPFTENKLTEVANDLDEVVVQVALFPLGKWDENWPSVVSATTKLHKEFPNLTAAVFYRMIA